MDNFQPNQEIIMKLLSRFVFVFLVGCIAFLALQTAHAQSIQTLSAVADSPITITATWTHGSGTTSTKYNVYLNDVKKTTFSHVPGSNQSHLLVVNPNTLYRVKVAAVNSSGTETGSKTTSVTTPTTVPSGVAVTQSGAGQQVRVRWDYINGPTSFTVYRSSNNGATWITSYSGPGQFGVGATGNEISATFSCPAGSYKFAVTSTLVVSNIVSNKSTAVSFIVE
jgi:hypothetical protein